MFCPQNRGGCGARLEWDDGAFCKSCMSRAAYERLQSMEVEKISADKPSLKNADPAGK
jgi:hypothetical protein